MTKDERKEDEISEEEVTDEETEQEVAKNDESQDEVKEETQEDENTRYMRLAADFQNYKRRAEKEKSDIYAYANEKIAADLLEVMDNFERSVEHVDDKGVHMILKQFKDVLAKHDIEEIDALGEEFDPNVHHAVVMEPSDDYKSGKVTEVMQKGYKLHDKVIRPSMVKVAE